MPHTAPLARREPAPQLDPELARVKSFARLLDQRFLDPLIGLVLPGAGDLIGSMLGIYTVVLAVRRKMAAVIIARMLTNLALDAAIGIIPLVGDLFDLGFKANTKNVALLTERAGTGGRATARDWLHVAGAALAFAAVVGLTIYAIVSLVRAVA
jgi:hypothetical protein